MSLLCVACVGHDHEHLSLRVTLKGSPVSETASRVVPQGASVHNQPLCHVKCVP